MPQSDFVDRAVAERSERASHVVQTIIAVDGGNDGNSRAAAQQHSHQVGARTVAVDDLIAVVADHGEDPAAHGKQRAVAQDGGRNPKPPRLLRKRTLCKADQMHIFRFVQTCQQGQHVRFRAADIPAGDHVDDFHSFTFPIRLI